MNKSFVVIAKLPSGNWHIIKTESSEFEAEDHIETCLEKHVYKDALFRIIEIYSNKQLIP